MNELDETLELLHHAARDEVVSLASARARLTSALEAEDKEVSPVATPL